MLDAARTQAAEALKLYETGQYAAAIELFEKADAQYPAPQYRVYAARAYGKSGKLRRAAEVYASALQLTPPIGAPASFREAQKTAVDELAEVRGRLAHLRIQVTGAPLQEVTLTVDDEPVPPAGWGRVELDPGRHQVTAVAAGYAGASQAVKLEEGAVENVALALLPVLPPSRRTAEIVAGGVGGAGLVVAVVTGGVLASKHAGIERDCPDKLCTPAGRALIDSTGPINAVNVVGWTLGLAGLAGLVVLVVVDRNGQKQTAIGPSALPGGGGLWITRRF